MLAVGNPCNCARHVKAQSVVLFSFILCSQSDYNDLTYIIHHHTICIYMPNFTKNWQCHRACQAETATDPGESFWEVAPDLADSPAAAWAMSLAFPAELKALFVECFGVREARAFDAVWGGNHIKP